MIRGLQVYNVETQSDIPVYDLGAAAGRDPYEMFLGGARSIIKITNPNAAQERRLIVFPGFVRQQYSTASCGRLFRNNACRYPLYFAPSLSEAD